ncbi:hypothetical protein ACFXD5_19615 [Streptomyces sp. NPDC059385]|uniref:hypothetical protein n=1 Tax=Streptomyces sp. NPDC059385 TaxID=3346817 RepID=UPI0036985484
MNRNAAITALAGAALLLAGCSSQPTYDESVQQCVKALKARHLDDKTKPKVCEPLKEDDYTLLVANQAMGDLGWTDKDGNFDRNKMLQSTPAP